MRNQFIYLLISAMLVASSAMQAQVVTWGTYGGTYAAVMPGTYLETGHYHATGANTQLFNFGNVYIRNNFNQVNSATYFTGGGSWLWFQGSVAQTISSDALLNIGAIRVDNAAGVRLNQNMVVGTSLQILGGDLDLNSFDINLGTTGNLSEDRLNNHLVVDNTPGLSESNNGGYIRATNRTTNGVLSQIAGLGIFLTNAGVVSIDRYHYQGTAGVTTIKKNYEITGTPSNTTMRIEFASTEAIGVTVDNSMKLYRYNGVIWQNQGGVWVDLPVDYVEQTGIGSFSPWSIGNSGFLPITLLDFQASRMSPSEVLLEWETASESDNAGFEIEKSYDGIQFQQIGFVQGAGNSTTFRSYEHVHSESEAAFYRLRQVDINGGFEYSQVRFVSGATGTATLVIYPNPAHDAVKLEILNGVEGEVYRFQFLQADGKLMGEMTGTLLTIQAYLDEKIPNTATGLYILRLESQQNVFVKRLALQ